MMPKEIVTSFAIFQDMDMMNEILKELPVSRVYLDNSVYCSKPFRSFHGMKTLLELIPASGFFESVKRAILYGRSTSASNAFCVQGQSEYQARQS